jgi:hypothetical protein
MILFTVCGSSKVMEAIEEKLDEKIDEKDDESMSLSKVQSSHSSQVQFPLS